jgi:hypothetical protein
LCQKKRTEVAIQRAVTAEEQDAISASQECELYVVHVGTVQSCEPSAALRSFPKSCNVSAFCARAGHRNDAAH